MKRRTVLLGLMALPTLSGAAQTNCPVCHGILVTAGSLVDDETKPSRNIDLWNRSYHAAFWPFFSAASLVCSRCFLAFREGDEKWVRSSEELRSFHVPLLPAITGFPLPPSDELRSPVVYGQEFGGAFADQGRSDSVDFWCLASTKGLELMQRHCMKHELKFKAERKTGMPGELYVSVNSPNKRFEPTRSKQRAAQA